MPIHPRNADDEEMGELSELFAPDAFIGTVLDTDETEVTAEVVEAVGVDDIHAVCAEEGEPCDSNGYVWYYILFSFVRCKTARGGIVRMVGGAYLTGMLTIV